MDGKVGVKEGLENEIAVKAQKMLDLVGLQKYPDTPTASDRRWLNGKDASLSAVVCLGLYSQASSKGAAGEFEEMLGIVASASGFFSIWMNVFDANPQAKRKIVEAFVGTAANSLNDDYSFKKRTEDL